MAHRAVAAKQATVYSTASSCSELISRSDPASKKLLSVIRHWKCVHKLSSDEEAFQLHRSENQHVADGGKRPRKRPRGGASSSSPLGSSVEGLSSSSSAPSSCASAALSSSSSAGSSSVTLLSSSSSCSSPFASASVSPPSTSALSPAPSQPDDAATLVVAVGKLVQTALIDHRRAVEERLAVMQRELQTEIGTHTEELHEAIRMLRSDVSQLLSRSSELQPPHTGPLAAPTSAAASSSSTSSRRPRVNEAITASSQDTTSRPPPRHAPAPPPAERIKYDGEVLVPPGNERVRWRLRYLGKGTFAQVYVGTLEGSGGPVASGGQQVAIKLALNPSHNIDRELINEAKVMQAVEEHRPDVVCRLYHQPRADDRTLSWRERGEQQPVFIAMELVTCDFHELRRSGKLSNAAACEAFLLTLLALEDVHESGVLHRDIKLNNIAFCATDGPSVRILDFGESVVYRPGDVGPRDYGQCRSEYASIARHDEQEQGYKDDVEMLLYTLLDVLMIGGLPWKRSQGPRLSREAMRDEKMQLRRYAGGQQSVATLVRTLKELDSVSPQNTLPYRRVEGAIRDAWECERQEQQRTRSALPDRLLACIMEMRSGNAL
jgi:hypothetical protein